VKQELNLDEDGAAEPHVGTFPHREPDATGPLRTPNMQKVALVDAVKRGIPCRSQPAKGIVPRRFGHAGFRSEVWVISSRTIPDSRGASGEQLPWRLKPHGGLAARLDAQEEKLTYSQARRALYG
jgi:hypothetical protein